MKQKTIADRWATLDGARQPILRRAEWCAAIAGMPWVLPPPGQQDTADLPEANCSIAAYGTTSVVGKLTATTFPPGRCFFTLDLPPKLKYGGTPEDYQRRRQQLYIVELMAMEQLETAHLASDKTGYPRSFRSQQRTSIEQVVITGDTLEMLLPNYQIRVFRRDQYVTWRDSAGSIQGHIIKECINPFSLTEDQFKKAGLDEKKKELEKADKPEVDSYTIVERIPFKEGWTWKQEINGKVYNDGKWNKTRIVATAHNLSPGENYGRGLIEMYRGDLASYNELCARTLEFASAASKITPVVDDSSQINLEDLTKPSGQPMYGRVQGGVIQDIALFKTDKLGDFQVVNATMERLRSDLGKAFMLDSAAAPQGEAGRHSYGWRVTGEELQGQIGGLLSAIGDEKQLPLAAAVLEQMIEDDIIPKELVKFAKVTMTTGQAAIINKQKLGAILEATQIFQQYAQFNPNILRRIDEKVFAAIVVRTEGIDEPGLIKSDEVLAREDQAAQAAQIQQAAAEQAIKSGGAIAEANAAPQAA